MAWTEQLTDRERQGVGSAAAGTRILNRYAGRARRGDIAGEDFGGHFAAVHESGGALGALPLDRAARDEVRAVYR